MLKTVKTIVIADGDEGVRKLVSSLFSDIGYKVVSSLSGADAISKSKEIKPDIVIANVSLPDRDGYELSGEIKSDPALESTPVVLVVQSFGMFDEGKAAECRADDFIIKPIKPDEMLRKVESLISQHEKREISLAFDLLSETQGGVGEADEFKMFDENTINGKEADYNNYNRAEEMKPGGASKSEEVILLEEEFESEKILPSDGEKIETIIDERSRAEIVDRVSEIIMKRLNEIIPESVSKVVDLVLKEELNKLKGD